MPATGNATVLWKFFGPRPGQAMTDFVKEVRELSDEEQQELADEVRKYQAAQPSKELDS